MHAGSHWAGPAAVASGLIPAYVLYRVGWSLLALPPLLLLVGLVQLAYCDLTRRLLPKTLVYALERRGDRERVAVAAVVPELGATGARAALGGLAFFAVFFVINLMNPRWIAYGDVRLSLVVGFGLAWVSPMALARGLLLRQPDGRRRRVRPHRACTGPSDARPCRSGSISPWARRSSWSPGS